MSSKEKDKKLITPMNRDYSQWYLDVIAAADLAENSPTKGCIVFKPNGYAIWEKIQKILDAMFKLQGVRNAYFPLLIPKKFLEKEAEHIKGFAKECAVVTHHRLVLDKKGKLVPAGLMKEPFIIRPTSETIIYSMYAKWIRSFRDLPLKLNQWANVVRWELRTRPFLRTTEFLWQEGHTAHATREEAEKMVNEILKLYRSFVEDYLAIPVIEGIKSESEKFAGAVYTASLEAMMQDGKALQIATSHMLGQNFSKPFHIRFLDKNGLNKYVWQTSWGISTRVIGALIMVHSDDRGLVLPPKIAPIPIVVIPIWDKTQNKNKVLLNAQGVVDQIKAGMKEEVHLDDRDKRPGQKFYDWERRGIPLRIEIGPRDILNRRLVLVRRDTGEKIVVAQKDLIREVKKVLKDIQTNLYHRALQYQKKNTMEVSSYDELKKVFLNQGKGFVIAPWCGDSKCEAKVKHETKATIRCILSSEESEAKKCVVCGKKSKQKVLFAKAY